MPDVLALDSQEKVQFRVLAKLHPKQSACFDASISRKNAVVLGGGSGTGGKSYMERAWCVWILLMYAKMGFPGQTAVLATSTYEALRDRHAAYLQQEWGDFGVIKGSHKIHGRCFLFDNPAFGAIELRNLGEAGERRGSEAAAGAVDELTEITRKTFGEFAYRIRKPGLPFNPMMNASNPDGVGFFWVRDLWRPQFYDAATGACTNEPARLAPYSTSVDPSGELEPQDYIYVPFLPDDNPTFDEKMFWRVVGHLPPHIQQSRRYGRWDAPEGARFPYLDPNVHLFDAQALWHGGVPEQYTKICHIDYGLRAPYCCLWTAFDYDGNAYTYRCDYQAGLTADAQAPRILEKTKSSEKINDIYLDPAMWQKFPGHNPKPGEVEPSAADIYTAILCKDPRFPGGLTPGYNRSRHIALMSLDKLLRRGNGFPDWHIDVSCAALWSELTGAVFPSGTAHKELSEDIDEKCPDHAITAAYYGLHTHMRLPTLAPQPLTTQELIDLQVKALDEKDLKMFTKATKRMRM